jgi:peptide/nickel transport system permease protein
MSTDFSPSSEFAEVLQQPNRTNRRVRKIQSGTVCVAFLVALIAGAAMLGDIGVRSNLALRLAPPSLDHILGTDEVGRDLFARVVKGMSLSIWVGVIASAASTLIAIGLALSAVAFGRQADAAVSIAVDIAMALPHIILLVLICVSLGGGTQAVIIAVALTHWTRLTRILRAEMLQLITSDYVLASRQAGKSWGVISCRHLIPHLVPQILVNFLLLFPHAIMHEAGLTFLGFGMEPNTPAIGVLLANAMRYLTAGYWWLGLFPGLALVIIVLAFDRLADGVRAYFDPKSVQD